MKFKLRAPNKNFWSADKLFGLSAMMISLITLIIFVRQTNIMEQQSRMSVMPYVLFELSDKRSEHLMILELVNHGVGPAIVDDVSIEYKGKSYAMDFYTFVKSIKPEMDSIEFLNHSDLYKGRAIPSGGRFNIWTIGATRGEYESFKKEFFAIQQHPSFDFEIRYKSIYDDYWIIDAKNGMPRFLD
ncbi:MAG: hypothetical protein AAGF77_03240 [Bacteroidota bacterium]